MAALNFCLGGVGGGVAHGEGSFFFAPPSSAGLPFSRWRGGGGAGLDWTMSSIRPVKNITPTATMASQSIRMSGGQPVPVLDLHVRYDWSTRMMQQSIYDALAKYEGNPPKAIPWLAERWEAPLWIRSLPPRTEHRRHDRKYTEGELAPDLSFYFRGPEGKLHVFEVVARDPGGEVMRGTHKRAIISEARLLEGAAKRKG